MRAQRAGQFLAVVTGLLFALAQTATAAPKKEHATSDRRAHSGKRIVEEPEEVVYKSSSEYFRQDKQASAVVELLGFAPLLGAGLAGGYYLNPDNLLELSYHKAELDFAIIKISTTLTELRLKHWFGNSFYLNGGVGLRTVEGEASLEPILGEEDISSTVSASSIGATIAIGNRWQWEYFTIGCDWIGEFLPVAKTEAEVTDSSDAAEDDVEEAKGDANDLALTNSSMALRFYLGASF
jgi:hypothetical protein